MDEEPQLIGDIYSEGSDSYARGLPRDNCPYPPGSAEREAWLQAWDRSARHDDADGEDQEAAVRRR